MCFIIIFDFNYCFFGYLFPQLNSKILDSIENGEVTETFFINYEVIKPVEFKCPQVINVILVKIILLILKVLE